MQCESQQPLRSKQGEVKFRRKLALQQSSDDQVLIPEAYNKAENLAFMRERIAKTREDIKNLIASRTRIAPYIELGAERCQRALLLENEFNANGFALDISVEMLRYAPLIAEEFGYKKYPLRIACDAYNLPFQSQSVGFAFCYQTLHHFPDPAPICREIARVLQPNSAFFFDEEPVRGRIKKLTQIYHRRGHRLSSIDALLDKVGLLGVFSTAGELEREYGVLEEVFDISTWRRALSSFDDFDVVVNTKLRIRMSPLNWGIKAILAQLVGGNIRALCKTAGSEALRPTSEGLLDILRCVNCKGKSRLIRVPTAGLKCLQCGSIYPEVDGVLLMFEKSLGSQLYPEYLS